MMVSLSQRERRLIALGLLVALIALVHFAVLSPLIGGFAGRAEERENLATAYARNARLLASIPQLRAQANAQRRDSGRYALAATTPQAASALLQERLIAEVTAVDAELKAVQEVSVKDGWARAWVDCRLTLPQLTQMLGRLENEPPLLIVESLSIAADRAAQTGRLDLMDVRVEVSGAYAAAPAQSR